MLQITNNNRDMKNKTVKIIALCVCFAVICGVVASTSALALWQNSDEYVRLANDKLRRVQGSVTLLDNKGSVRRRQKANVHCLVAETRVHGVCCR